MISFDRVSFAYDADPRQALRDFSLTVHNGECLLITGPSGCGKSTVLRLVNGLIPEFYGGKVRGSIRINGENMGDTMVEDRAGVVGTVFQNPRSQFFNVDTTSELAFGPENLALPEAEIVRRIRKTVSDLHIGDLMDRNIFHLSGGEKQKIACASVDVLAPEIVLLDEPSANLDYRAGEELRELIRCWRDGGKTILIAEHRINYLWDIADRVAVMRDGALVEELSREEMECLTEESAREMGLRSLRRIPPESLVTCEELELREERVTALVGANGAGKTTYLNALCKKELGRCFMVMQDVDHQLFTESVLDEVLISQPVEDREEALGILRSVGLEGLEDRHPMSLSGGQKQRTALACAIASRLPLLLLDEPTSGLDYQQMRNVAEILNGIKKEGRKVLAVTHDSEFIEHCCDDVVLMERRSRG